MFALCFRSAYFLAKTAPILPNPPITLPPGTYIFPNAFSVSVSGRLRGDRVAIKAPFLVLLAIALRGA